MSGDPKECRAHALRCAELAANAKTSQLRATFLGLSKQWETFAVELEKAQALSQEETIEFKTSA